MRKLSKKGKVYAVAASVALVTASGGAAFAYWTTTGGGTGSGATGTNTSITVVQTSTVTDLKPGGAAQTLSGTFTNTNTSPVYVANVTASIASVTKAVGAPAGTCDLNDFTIVGPTMSVTAEIPASSTLSTWGGATIAFFDKPTTNQDACKGATVNISYAVQ